MMPRDKNDRAVRPGDVVHMIGRVELAPDENAVLVKINDHLSQWVHPKALEVIADDAG